MLLSRFGTVKNKAPSDNEMCCNENKSMTKVSVHPLKDCKIGWDRIVRRNPIIGDEVETQTEGVSINVTIILFIDFIQVLKYVDWKLTMQNKKEWIKREHGTRVVRKLGYLRRLSNKDDGKLIGGTLTTGTTKGMDTNY